VKIYNKTQHSKQPKREWGFFKKKTIEGALSTLYIAGVHENPNSGTLEKNQRQTNLETSSYRTIL
jgi:hypothetical protein